MRQSVINSSADLLLRAVRSALNVIIQRVDLSEKLTGQEYITGSSTALTNTTDHSLCPSNQESENADVFDDNMSPKMTEQSLRNICVKHSQYTVPELNDILYLHYIGFRKIENLDKYTGVKCLWLSHNGISKIENLSNLPLLTCLYLQNNCINSINGIKHIRSLKVLNLSHNFIRHVTDEISQLSHLISLDISHNYISGGLKFLSDCKNMTTLDISNNKIDRIDEFFQITNLQQVKVLNLMGNSVLGMIGNYRLNMVLDMMNLTYLDDMPVFYRERLSAEAWQICGSDGINAINEQLNNERSKKQDECVQGVVKRLKDSHTYVEEDDIRHSDSESLWSFDQIDTDEESTAYTDAAGDHTTISEIERFKSDHGFISIQVDVKSNVEELVKIVKNEDD